MRVAVGLLRISRATQFPRRVIPSKIGLFDKIEDQHKSKQNSSFSVFLDRPCLKYRSSLPQSRHCKSYLLFLSFSVSLSLSPSFYSFISLSRSLYLSLPHSFLTVLKITNPSIPLCTAMEAALPKLPSIEFMLREISQEQRGTCYTRKNQLPCRLTWERPFSFLQMQINASNSEATNCSIHFRS